LSFLKTSTARIKSLRPKGVGSVTKIQKSLPFIDSITEQDVPGGASMMTVLIGLTSLEIDYLWRPQTPAVSYL